MRLWTASIALTVIMGGVALGEQPCSNTSRGPAEVILDFKNHLALVPEGTILPAGMRISGKYGTRNVADPRRVPDRLKGEDKSRPRIDSQRESDSRNAHAFVFAYAPDKAFAAFRDAAKRSPGRIKPTDTCNFPFVYYAQHPECPTCSITLSDSQFIDPCSVSIDDYTEYHFADVTPATYSFVLVDSSDDYFSCFQSAYDSSSSCSTSDTRHYVGGYPTWISVQGYNEWYDLNTYYYLSIDVLFYNNSVHRNP